MKARWIAVSLAVSSAMWMAVEAAPVRGEEGMTRVALQVVYQREVSAEWQYAACAHRAELEGYLGARDLFAALGACEAVHARLHGFSLEQMDVTPVAVAGGVVVDSTRENLRASFENEMNERRAVYGRVVEIARAEDLYDVLAEFRYARDAEATHARALADAYFHLGDMLDAHTYYVCKGCGALRCEASRKACECGGSAGGFVAVRGPETFVRMIATR